MVTVYSDLARCFLACRAGRRHRQRWLCRALPGPALGGRLAVPGQLSGQVPVLERPVLRGGRGHGIHAARRYDREPGIRHGPN